MRSLMPPPPVAAHSARNFHVRFGRFQCPGVSPVSWGGWRSLFDMGTHTPTEGGSIELGTGDDGLGQETVV